MNKLNFKSVICIFCFCCASVGLYAQSFLHAEGYDMVDENGHKVLLQGVGLGNWMLQEGYMWKFGEKGDRPRRIEKIVSDYLGVEKAAIFWKTYRENYITEADIKRIAELGYNSVRPALNSRLFITEGEKNEFVDEGFQLLDKLISWCKKYHLYVIIDMHGAPGGQTGQNIDDSPNNEPELFMNKKNEDLLVKLWMKIATRYKDEPIVAAYDLLNEPLPENTGAAAKYKDRLVPVYERLIKAIREVDKKHMFTLEGYNWANNWSMFTKSLDDNMFFQFHYYCWDRPDNLNDISGFLEKREQLKTPVWVGETGEKNNSIYYATTQYFETNNIGWSFWPWKKMDTSNTPYSIKSPEGWKDITDYSRGGTLTSAIPAEKIFNDLLENIKLENCQYYPDVVNAMFRRVPLLVEAENYGHDGFLKSYFVKDTLSHSSVYRKKEPVKIQPVDADGNSKTTGQAIILAEGEWTAYTVTSLQESRYNLSLQAKAVGQPAEIIFFVDENPVSLNLNQTGWSEQKLVPQLFVKGENKLKIEVKSGTVAIDWINIQQ